MSIQPIIFYAPHQDDEAIGMAGAVQEQKEAGRAVYLVLLTDGVSEDWLKILDGRTFCRWHHTYHDLPLTMEQMIWARKVEFVASAARLGADKIFILDDAQGLDDTEPYIDYRRFVPRVADAIKRFEAKFPGASHRLVSGSLDLLPDGTTNPTHRACWDAAASLRSQISDFKFYRVYTYFQPVAARTAQFQLNLKPAWRVAKQAALNEYKLFKPEAGRFAIGYHSAPELIDAAYNDDKEYLDLLP